MNAELLIVFYRNPEIGKVKSRLAATIGEEKALAVYLKMAAHTRCVSSCVDVDRVVYYSEYVDTEDNWLNEIFEKSVQMGVDLGEKMKHAFEASFNKGYESVCIIGTDCPDLTEDIVKQAFEALNKHDIVIGPAKDGGYYLLGMKKLHPQFFSNKRWSTDSVFTDTVRDIRQAALRYYLLPELSDVDEEKDIPDSLS